MDECGPIRASASASPAHQSNLSRTRERSWLTLSSAACITITAGAHWIAPHSLALPECQSVASFLPATIWWPRCRIQPNRSPRQLSMGKVRTRCLMHTPSSNSAGQRYCKSPSDGVFSYPWTSVMGLNEARPVAFGLPKGSPERGTG